MNEKKISKRQNKILNSVIDAYINTAQPVGSRILGKRYDLGVSPATIRNEMSDLEELGLLIKVHSSSGRIPSDSAYRIYVDEIMKSIYNGSDSGSKLIPISKAYNAYIKPEKIVSGLTKMLSEVSHLPVCGMVRRNVSALLKHIEIIKMNKNQYFIISIYETGDVNNSFIYLKNDLSSEELKKINYIMNSYFSGLSISEIRNIMQNISVKFTENIEVLHAMDSFLKKEYTEIQNSDIYREGISNIFNYPEYQDLNKAVEIIKYLEDNEKLNHLFENSSNEYLNVSIGDENKKYGLSECSVLSSSYFFTQDILGKIIVLGPTRMDYSFIIDIMLKLSIKINNFV